MVPLVVFLVPLVVFLVPLVVRWVVLLVPFVVRWIYSSSRSFCGPMGGSSGRSEVSFLTPTTRTTHRTTKGTRRTTHRTTKGTRRKLPWVFLHSAFGAHSSVPRAHSSISAIERPFTFFTVSLQFKYALHKDTQTCNITVP